jgi:hypothetical protein
LERISRAHLQFERLSGLAEAGGGASLPAAGAVYWSALGLAGLFVEPRMWCLVAAFGSAAIFPLGIVLQRPFASRIIGGQGSVLDGVAPLAVLGINLLWPLYLALIFAKEYAFVPLALGLGMTVHWPVIGWLYNSRACFAHAIVRTIAVSAIWYFVPEQRFIALPFAVAIIYAVTVVWLSAEAAAARRALARG